MLNFPGYDISQSNHLWHCLLVKPCLTVPENSKVLQQIYLIKGLNIYSQLTHFDRKKYEGNHELTLLTVLRGIRKICDVQSDRY